jgi:hypothetical protein
VENSSKVRVEQATQQHLPLARKKEKKKRRKRREKKRGRQCVVSANPQVSPPFSDSLELHDYFRKQHADSNLQSVASQNQSHCGTQKKSVKQLPTSSP